MATPSSRRSCSTQLRRFRARAFARQRGRCHYCDYPLLDGNNPSSFATLHGLTCKQALRLQATAEHLIPRQDGGEDTEENIVAACMHCNVRRHRRRRVLNAGEFRKFVRGRPLWHGFTMEVERPLPPQPHNLATNSDCRTTIR